MNRLQGKRTLITGGTSGIGLETARQFLAEGARVAVTGSTAENLARAREVLGSEVLVIRSDAGTVAEQTAVAQQIKESFGSLDALFVNAGIAGFYPLEAADEAAFDRMFAVNVKGPLFLVKALLPVFANPASILLNASVNLHIGVANSSVYGASKAALVSLIRSLSAELVGRGIRVNAISPGAVSTPIFGKMGFTPEQVQAMGEQFLKLIPVGRYAQPIEIAKAAVFFASDESSYALGSELILDGGLGNL